MDLISIAHPDFRPWLIEEAKRLKLIYKDQAYIPGKCGEYPESLAIHRTTRSSQEILLRPVKISDEPLIKDFFYSLSDESLYTRFISTRRNVPHEMRQRGYQRPPGLFPAEELLLPGLFFLPQSPEDVQALPVSQDRLRFSDQPPSQP